MTAPGVPMTAENTPLPGLIYAHASPHSVGGRPLFDGEHHVTTENIADFHSEQDLVERAARNLAEAGFIVLHQSPVTINIAGPPELYERVFHTRLRAAHTVKTSTSLGGPSALSALDASGTEQRGLISTTGTDFADTLEGVAIDEPRIPHGGAETPPKVGYWHLDVPDALVSALRAEPAHAAGITGRDVRVIMVDTGHHTAHPYFAARKYRINPVVLAPGTTDTDTDMYGHGTAESANLLSIAPECDFTMVKMSFTNSVGALNTAIDLHPQILSCSWGSDLPQGPLSAGDQALSSVIARAVAKGVIVVASAGDGQYSFPGQHPDVISVGGAFLSVDGSLRASDYASGFISNVFPSRTVPDVSGLVGMRPNGVYLMLPVPPGSAVDKHLAGGYPQGDETTPDDGWACLSGTSASAPQVAAACALLLQVNSDLRTAQLREVLQRTARDVVTGHSFQNTPAGIGPDAATGYGLVDVAAAVAEVR